VGEIKEELVAMATDSLKVPVNPWNADYWPGGSSSGSGVATAAGLCFASIGTDAGGSIRFPALANGTVGLKPTYGRVSRHGVLALAEFLDHEGPMARRVADAAVTLQAIAGWDEHDPTAQREPVPDMLAGLQAGVRGLQLGIDRRFCAEGTDAQLLAAIEAALATWSRLGAEAAHRPGQLGGDADARAAVRSRSVRYALRTADARPASVRIGALPHRARV
jgi:amidase